MAELLPADKVSHLEQIKQSGATVFVGDGMNDAPVLAMADVGVAMGLGTDAAIEAADVVLVSDKLSDLPQAIKLAKTHPFYAKFNIVFAFVHQSCGADIGCLRVGCHVDGRVCRCRCFHSGSTQCNPYSGQ